MTEEARSTGRRTVLKSLGAVAAGAVGISGTALASDVDEISDREYRRLLLMRYYDNWDDDKWRTELANRGANFKYQDFRVVPAETVSIADSGEERVKSVETEPYDPLEEEDSVGTSALKEYKCRLRLTYTDTANDYSRLNYTWSLKDGWVSFAEPPKDFAAISFEESLYDFEANTTNFGWKASGADGGGGGGMGPGALSPYHRMAEFYDNSAALNSTGRFDSFLDVGIRPTTYKPPEERNIYADYVHRWTDRAGFEDITITNTGGGISLFTGTGNWMAETVATEAQMNDSDGYLDKDPV